MRCMNYPLGLALFVFSLSAHAALITLPPAGGTTTVLTTIPGNNTASSVVAGGYTVTGSPDIWYGDSPFGFYNNGEWVGLEWVGGVCPEGGCTATFDLGGSFAAVGGFMNYAHDSGPATITALASDGVTVLETYDLVTAAPINVQNLINQGGFRGIARSQADIAYLRTFGSYLVLNSLTVSRTVLVPEPGTLFLAGFVLCALATVRRGRRPC
jgi:hypothetical protein